MAADDHLPSHPTPRPRSGVTVVIVVVGALASVALWVGLVGVIAAAALATAGAALHTPRRPRHDADLDASVAGVKVGPERRSRAMRDREREVVAWHEAGHALVGALLPDAHEPVQVSIVPRGDAGGVTWFGSHDESVITEDQARAQLAVALGGRVAEEMLLDGDHTQGAEGDLQHATRLARRMVTDWGMSNLGVGVLSSVGPVRADDEDVRAETARLVGEACETAAGLLADRRPLLDALVRLLLRHETVDGDAVRRLVDDLEGALVA